MPELYEATIINKKPEAEAQVLLTLRVPKEVWSRHIYHSQYVDLVLPGMAPWHGTIACRPGFEDLEFLVKDVSERSHRISSLEAGDELQVSLPTGDGFEILAVRNHDVILAATGVAICALRPVIQEILLARGDWGRVMLFYGERTADRFAFIEEQETWKERKIEVHLTASQPSKGTYWKGATGYVQDYLVEVEPDVGNAVAMLAGKDGMIRGFSDNVMRMGMSPNRIFLNT